MVTATRSPDPRSNVKVRPCPRTYRNRLRPRIANASSTQCGQGRGWGVRLMANPNHLDLLREGVEGLVRLEGQRTIQSRLQVSRPQLCYLRKADLSLADLSWADINVANLDGAI